jgi:hypothetical protein
MPMPAEPQPQVPRELDPHFKPSTVAKDAE